MATVSLKLKIPRRKEIDEILGKVRYMEQKAVNWLIANKKSGIATVHHYFPELHSQWVVSALKTASGIASAFRKVKKKQKQQKRMRRRLLNRWSIMTFHRIPIFEAAKYGVPVVTVSPAYTSQICPLGEKGEPCERDSNGICSRCCLNRHHAAAWNIAYKGLEKLPNLASWTGLAGMGRGVMGAPISLSSGGAIVGEVIARGAVTTESCVVAYATA